MPEVIDSYKYLGLHDGASALTAVLNKFMEIDDDDIDEFQSAIDEAYDTVENMTPELEDRLAIVRIFVRENSRLFGVEV